MGTATQVTFFGGASLEAGFEAWVATLSYRRRQSTTSGDGLASSLDRVFGEIEYAPQRPGSVFIAGSWDRRRTLTEATVVEFGVVAGPGGAAQRDLGSARTHVEDRRRRRDNYTAIVGTRREIDRRFSTTLEFRYRHTTRSDFDVARPAVDAFLLLLSVDYAHAPFRLGALAWPGSD